MAKNIYKHDLDRILTDELPKLEIKLSEDGELENIAKRAKSLNGRG